MNARVRTSLIIAAMVTLCMFALPGVADQAPSASASPALSFALPLNSTGATAELRISYQTLDWVEAQADTALSRDCEAPAQEAVDSGTSRFSTAALTSGFEMPFFSVAGLLGGAVRR